MTTSQESRGITLFHRENGGTLGMVTKGKIPRVPPFSLWTFCSFIFYPSFPLVSAYLRHYTPLAPLCLSSTHDLALRLLLHPLASKKRGDQQTSANNPEKRQPQEPDEYCMPVFFLPPKCYHCFCVAWKLWSRTLEDVEKRLQGLVWCVTCGKDLSTEPGQVVGFSSVNGCGSNCWLRPTFKNQGTGFQFLLKSVKARKTLTQASS